MYVQDEMKRRPTKRKALKTRRHYTSSIGYGGTRTFSILWI